MENAATIKRRIRQVRSRLSTPVGVLVEGIELPKGVMFKLYNFHLGGAGIGIPFSFNPKLSKEQNLKANSFPVKIRKGKEIKITVLKEKPFKREMFLRCEVCFSATVVRMNDAYLLYYYGLKYCNISNTNFSTIESAMLGM